MNDSNLTKVVWICHFTNQEIQDVLKPVKSIGEIAPWISALYSFLEGQAQIELHIVSPHEYIGACKHFTIRGVHFHFFNAHIPFWGRHWPGFIRFDYWTDFFLTKRKIWRIINKIQPDIIHLHGAENAYYSSSILQFKDRFPVLVTIQGFISNTSIIRNKYVNRRIWYEREILRTFRHFGYRTLTMGDDIRKINPKATLHWHNYPCPEIQANNAKKKYDIVYFGRITKDKGVEDLLHVLTILKKDKPEISLCMIGGANVNYLDYLKELALKLKITENVFWAGFLPAQSDVHLLASSARICVVPTYHDIISGTIIESMFLKLPVVAYDVGSIHEVNQNGSVISLVKKGDIEGLKNEILKLLNDEPLLKNMGEKGFSRANEMLDNGKVLNELLKAYQEVRDDFKKE